MRIGICYKKIAPLQNWRIFLIQRQNSRYYRCSVWKTKVDIKANLHENWNMQIANCILEYFEQFSQMSTKSILIIISSYTVSNLVHFFDTVYLRELVPETYQQVSSAYSTAIKSWSEVMVVQMLSLLSLCTTKIDGQRLQSKSEIDAACSEKL